MKNNLAVHTAPSEHVTANRRTCILAMKTARKPTHDTSQPLTRVRWS